MRGDFSFSFQTVKLLVGEECRSKPLDKSFFFLIIQNMANRENKRLKAHAATLLELVYTKIESYKKEIESSSVDSFSEKTIKQLNSINATIRLLQAQQRMANQKMTALISLISSIMGSSLVFVVYCRLFS